jgi:hypothetical protein
MLLLATRHGSSTYCARNARAASVSRRAFTLDARHTASPPCVTDTMRVVLCRNCAPRQSGSPPRLSSLRVLDVDEFLFLVAGRLDCAFGLGGDSGCVAYFHFT